MGAGLHIVGVLDGRGEVVEFGLRARDEENVEAALGELESVFFAYAVRGAGDDSPAAFGAEFGELEEESVRMVGSGKRDVYTVDTFVPGMISREAIKRQKLNIFNDNQTTPMRAKSLVVGAAQGSIGLTESMIS